MSNRRRRAGPVRRVVGALAVAAYVFAVVGLGLLLRGFADWGCGFLCAAVALVAGLVAATPLRRIEVAVAAALVFAGAAQGHWAEGAGAAAIAVLAIELSKRLG
jgi:hypothetical protein